MQKELEVWKAENERHAEAIRKEERYVHVHAALEKKHCCYGRNVL